MLTAIIFDANVFLAISGEMNADDTVYAIIKISETLRSLGHTAVTTLSVINEIRSSIKLRETIRAYYKIMSVPDERVADFIKHRRGPVLTKQSKKTDYELILLSLELSRNFGTVILVTSDYLLAKEASALSSGILSVDSFVLFEDLSRITKNSYFTRLSDVVLKHIISTREPEDFLRYWDEFRNIVVRGNDLWLSPEWVNNDFNAVMDGMKNNQHKEVGVTG
ncbi:MAG: hypothetical protein QW728_05575, partial [Thermoplasmata archaeon]